MPNGMEGWSPARRVAQPFLREAAQVHEMFARWYEEAREAGISYRRTDMLADWRREKGLVIHQTQMEGLLPETQPPTGWWTETPWEGLSTSLLYEFRFTGRDAETQEGFDRFIGVGTDKHLTVGEAIEQFMEEYVAANVYGKLEDVSLTLMSVRHKVGAEVT